LAFYYPNGDLGIGSSPAGGCDGERRYGSIEKRDHVAPAAGPARPARQAILRRFLL